MEGVKERLKRFDFIVSKLRDTYERKNTDYGNSFEESLDEFGAIAFVVRADDKMRRLKQLVIGQVVDWLCKTLEETGDHVMAEDIRNIIGDKFNAKVSESFNDTAEDLANYCIMAEMWRDKQC